MIEFYQTVMGKRFFEGTMPKLTDTLERIATCMEKQLEPATKSDDHLIHFREEYFEIDKLIMEEFEDDYSLGEGSDMLLSQLVELMLRELKARREGTFHQ